MIFPNFNDFSKNLFSVLNLNTRRINKNFEYFSDFYATLNHIFSVIWFSVPSEENISKNSAFQLKNYNVIDQVRNSRKRGALYIYIFIYKSLCYKLNKVLSINSEAIESIFKAISNKKARSLLFSSI